MSRRSKRDSFYKQGSDGSGSNTNLHSVSLAIKTSDPNSEDPQTSIMFTARAGPASENPFSRALSASSDFFEKRSGRSGQFSKDSFTGSDPESSSSFLAFSMSQSFLQPPKEMSSVPKPKRSITSAFMTLSKGGPETDFEPTEMPSVSRLSPHRYPSKNTSASSNQVHKHIQTFKLSKDQLLYVKNSMQKAMENGRKHGSQRGSSLPVLPTYICALPDGTERGYFLALEMTQTNVKVLLFHMTEADIRQGQMRSKTFPISEGIRRSAVDQYPSPCFSLLSLFYFHLGCSCPSPSLAGVSHLLFDFLGECVASFLLEIGPKEKYLPLGFCFPFACKHVSMNKCFLINASKNFWWPGMEGKDVGEQLQKAINKHCKNHQIEVLAVVNDTVATMLSGCKENAPCEVGLVIDAGTNCCYMEQAQEIIGIEEKEGRMCVNTEFGTFGKVGELDSILTEFDILMDKQSMDPGEHRFEKLISSLYICDTVRVFLAHLAEKGEMLNGVLTPNLLTRGNFELQDIVDIIDEKNGLSKAKSFLLHLGMVASNQDCFYLQKLCQAVFVRSASLSAAGLAAVLTQIADIQKQPKLKINVAVDGVLFTEQKQYADLLTETLKWLVPDYTINFIPTRGNCILGVVLAIAAAIRHKNQRQQVAQVLAPFRLSVSDLERVRHLMRMEMAKGLKLDSSATVRMLPTYVRHLPDGSERGKYLALDLGGTNFRVLLVELKDPKQGGVHITSEIYTVPPEIAQSNATKLFNHIVSCIVDFETKHKILGTTLPLGFTFSFPCRQIGLDKGILLAWTKGFSASDCVGQDAVQLLRDAVKTQKNVDIDIVAIVNDTVGTMMSCAYVDPKCEIGLIVGTGSNTCYMEEMKNVDAVQGDEGQMCINMEWGAFGDAGCLDSFMTPYDVRVDAESINAGQQRFEKLISGMYLGEIVRYILLELTSRKLLFRGQDSPVLHTKGIFPTKFLSDVEGSQSEGQVHAVMEEYKLNLTAEDARLVKEVCRAVSSRAAKMCGAGIAAVVDKMRDNRQLDKLQVTVGVDGTLYKVHPRFSKELQETVTVLAPKCQVKFLLSEDGSGKGAALVAAVAIPHRI